jgi:hypothetical protein
MLRTRHCGKRCDRTPAEAVIALARLLGRQAARDWITESESTATAPPADEPDDLSSPFPPINKG